MMQSISMMLALLVGAGLVVQVALNMTISKAVGSAPLAALANFVVGTAVIIVLLLVFRVELPTREQWSVVPWWAWLGGALGAAYVATATFTGPRLGALLLLALTVGGQMIASMIVDHYGLLGFAREPLDTSRVIGALLLCVGIFLIAR